jgi:hypothetical protein
MRAFCLLAWILPLAGAAPAFAQEDEPEVPPPPAGEPDAEVPSFASAPAPSPPTKLPIPPGVDYPPVQALRGESTIYLDYTYEISNDLSTFYWVKGHAAGHRVALGGNLHLGGLQLNAELPVQLTQLFIDSLGNQAPTAADREKSSYSLADVIAGGSYVWGIAHAPFAVFGGLGMRVRLPTHTMSYRFTLIDGSPYSFGFPYYFHLAPAGLFFAAWGPVSLTVNQGLLAMLAQNTTLLNLPVNIPNVFFWESHYAVALRPVHWLGLSFELISCIQLSHIYDQNFQSLNRLKAFYLDPGVSFDIGSYRISLAGRFGPGKDTERFGVITFSGSQALLARLSYLF